MRIFGVTVWVVEVPLVPPVAPYRSPIRTSSTTRSAILRVDTDAGLTGDGYHSMRVAASRARGDHVSAD